MAKSRRRSASNVPRASKVTRSATRGNTRPAQPKSKSARAKAKSPKPAPRSAARRPKGSARNITAPAQPPHHIELIARGLWLHGSHVLLCRSVAKGYRYLPGGHVDFGESAAAAVEREFLEEAGAPVAAGDLLLVTEGSFETRKRRHHELNLVFTIRPRLPDGADAPPADPAILPPITSLEPEIAFDWVDLAAIVDLDVRPLAIKAWLAAAGWERPTPTPPTSSHAATPTAEWISEIPPPRAG